MREHGIEVGRFFKERQMISRRDIFLGAAYIIGGLAIGQGLGCVAKAGKFDHCPDSTTYIPRCPCGEYHEDGLQLESRYATKAVRLAYTITEETMDRS